MTDLRQTAGAVGIILFLATIIAVASFIICGGVTLFADWLLSSAIPAVRD